MSTWVKLYDPESGCFYYCETTTGHTTWDIPSECKRGLPVVADSLSNLKWQVPGRVERVEFAQLRGQYIVEKSQNIVIDQEIARREAERKEKERQDEIWNKRIEEAKSTLHLKRTEERRVGKECGRTCRYGWSAYK